MSKPEPKKKTKPCDHTYEKVGHYGRIFILYRCTKCGDEYEKDVS